MSSQAKKVGLEQRFNVDLVPFAFKVTFKSNTTAASITSFSDVPGEITVFNALTAGSIPAGSGLNSPALVNTAAPVIVGIYMNVGDALEVADLIVDTGSIVSTTMTAGVVARKGDDSSRPGILSTTKGICFQVSCTTLDGDLQTSDTSFWVRGTYVKDARQS